MDHPRDKELEELLHRQLSKLPLRKAPSTLIPRVLAAIEAKSRLPWWKRPWPTWPNQWRLLSIPVLLAVCFAMVFGAVQISEWNSVQLFSQNLSGSLGGIVPLFKAGLTLLKAALTSTAALGHHWLLLGAAVVFIMYFACIGIGTACFRLACCKR
jgi:hypothetical protein